MPDQQSSFRGQAAAILVIGLGIGWLAGLSMAPAVSALIASLLGLTGGLAAVHDTRWGELDARPLALLVLGIAVGAPAGVVVRSRGVLGPVTAEDSTTDTTREVGLYGVSADECTELLAAGADIRVQFRRSGSEALGRLGEQIEDPGILRMIAEALCLD